MKKKLYLGAFTLAMINVAAIGSVKNWPLSAEYGLSSLAYLLLATLVFFLPVAFVTAELASTWPERGGVYVWVKEAFGHRTGFFAIWLFWVLNVIWAPTLLSFIAATLAYMFNASWNTQPLPTLIAILLCLWVATAVNLRGMRLSGWVSTLGAWLGTLIPAVGIIALGALWDFNGNPMNITFNVSHLIPDLSSIQNLVFFAGIILSFSGMEMSAIHAKEVCEPKKSYPRAILLSGILILGLTGCGVLSIASVVPEKQINLVSGSLQAFSLLLNSYGLGALTPWMALAMLLGAFGSLSTWLIGSSKGLLAAARAGDLPPFFHSMTSRGVPKHLLFVQAAVISVLSLLFVFMPSVSSAFWILSALVTQLYLIVYLLFFAAAWRLRALHPHKVRPYKVPGGKWGLGTVCGVGMLSCAFTFFIGFVPPSQIQSGNLAFYLLFLALSIGIACALPAVILHFQRRWRNHG